MFGNSHVFFKDAEGGVLEQGGDASRLDISLSMSDVDGKASGSVPLLAMAVVGLAGSTLEQPKTERVLL